MRRGGGNGTERGMLKAIARTFDRVVRWFTEY